MASTHLPLLRPATAADEAFLLGLTPRLAGFPLPSWRTAEEIAAADHPLVLAALRQPSPETLILIAEDPPCVRAGYVMVTTSTDYFTHRRQAHVEILVVTEAAEGRGLGRALLAGAEEWANQHGYAQITLNVFVANQAARGLYEHLGYEPELIRYRKALRLDRPGSPGGADESIAPPGHHGDAGA